jgi:multiple sugar transport system permease protein
VRGAAIGADGLVREQARGLRYLFDRDAVLGPALLMPSVLYLAGLVGFPLVLVFLYAFSDVTTGSTGLQLTGLATFEATVRDPVFATALRNTFVFTFFSQLVVVILAVILGFVLSANFRGRWMVRFLILLPWTTPIALSGLVWLWMLDSLFSPFNWILAAVGVIHHGAPVAWLGSAPMAMGSVTALQAWRVLPLATVIVMAGLTSIPQDIKEQAEVDGAGFWRRLFDVIFPLITPIVMVALVFGIVTTFTDMTVVFILTSGGPENATQVLASWSFLKGIQGGDLSHGAALGLFMFPVLLGITVLMLRLISRSETA